MAVGGDVATTKQFKLPRSGITLTISEGNIIESSAGSIATGEDRNIAGYGEVSQLLLKTCPKEYKSAREQMIKTRGKVELCDVLSCPFPNPKSGRKKGVSFSLVLHAVVPSAKEVTDQKQWKDKMRKLYYTLFKEADKHGKASLALPLLGSGGAGATPDAATDILAHALVHFHRDNREPRHILKDITVYARKEAFSKIVTKVTDELASLLQTNGVTSHSSVSRARPSGSNKPRQASASSRNRSANAGSGHAKARQPGGSTRAAAREAAAHKTAQPRASPAPAGEDECSNLSVILSGVSLDHIEGGGKDQLGPEEEYMDVDVEDEDRPEDDLGEREEDIDDDEVEEREKDEEAEICAICLYEMDNPKKLDKCSHTFCTECIEDSFRYHKPACPTCNTLYGVITGNQPRGTMKVTRNRQGLPGYQNCGMLIIDYHFSSGTQGKEHPNPGQPYSGTRRQAFLPDCEEGRKVYRLLRVAFDNRLIFTVGRSRTTGAENVVTWNDIHHKTSIEGGATGFGYPDPLYLSRVQEELAARGVTEECLKGRSFEI